MNGCFQVLLRGLTVLFTCLSGFLFAQTPDTLLPINENGKWGFINTKGVQVFPCEFEAALYWGTARYGKVKKDGHWQFITRKGLKPPLPISGIPESFNDSILIIRSNEGKYLISEKGKLIFPDKFTNINALGEGYFRYYSGDSCGLGHIAKGIITPPVYDEISNFKELGFTILSCNKYGLLDLNGRTILPPIYNSIGSQNNGLLQVWVGEASKTGMYDLEKSDWLIPSNWEELSDSNSCFLVMQDERGFSLYNRKINQWSSEIFTQIELKNDLAIIQSDTGKGIIDADNRVVFDPCFTNIHFEQGVYLVQQNDSWRLYTKNGKALSKDSFLNIQRLSSPAWVLEKDNEWILMNSLGNVLLTDMHKPEIFGNKVKYFDGTTMTSLSITENGQIASKHSFDNVVQLKVNGFRDKSRVISRMAEGQAMSDPESIWFMDEKSRKWGLKRADGKIVINPVYDYIRKNPNYNYTHVYLKIIEKEFYFLRNYMTIGARAGLVDNESGQLLVKPIYLDVFVTGSVKSPLFFGITEQVKFKQVIPSRDIYTPTYAWVEHSNSYPIRALLSNGLPRRANDIEDRIFNQQELFSRILNPAFDRYSSSKYYSWSWGKYDIERWVYLYPGESFPTIEYSKAEKYKDGLMIAQEFKSKKYGLLSQQGSVELPFVYANIERTIVDNDTLYKVIKADSNYNLITPDNDIFSTEIGNNILRYDGENVFIKTSSALGFFDDKRNQVLFGDAQKMGELKDGIIPVRTDSKWKYYTENGTPFHSKHFLKAYDFCHGKALVKERGKWYFLNTQGTLSEALPWKNMKPLCDGRFMAYDGKRWFLTNTEGIAIHEEGFVRMKQLKDSEFVLVKKGSKWGLLNIEGEQLTEIKYDRIQYLGDDLLSLDKGKKLYLKHASTKEKRVKRYTHISKTNDGIFALRNKKGWIVADTSLKHIGDQVFRSVRTTNQGYFIGNDGKGNCLVDPSGNLVFSTQERLIGDFSDGYILSYDRLRQMYFYLNVKGDNAFSKFYQKALPFEQGKAWVKTKDAWGCIDMDGEWIVKPYFYNLTKVEGAYVGTTGVLYGLFDKNANVLLEPMYNHVEIKEKRLLYGEIGTHVEWKGKTGEKIYKRGVVNQLATKP
ncbi:MAG: WG repeat-containing protein [Bacteroidia bacterium]